MNRSAAQCAEERERLLWLEPGDLGRTGSRRDRRVHDVDVERQEGGPVADAVAHSGRIGIRAQRAKLLALDDLEPPAARLVEIGGRIEAPPHAREQAPVRVDHPLFQRSPERRAVEVALSVVRVPGVRVGVEENDARRTMRGGVSP